MFSNLTRCFLHIDPVLIPVTVILVIIIIAGLSVALYLTLKRLRHQQGGNNQDEGKKSEEETLMNQGNQTNTNNSPQVLMIGDPDISTVLYIVCD